MSKDASSPNVPPERTPAAGARPAARTRAATVLGNYRLLRKLGQGGMGTVFKAEDVRDGRLVAVKVLARALADRPAAVQRFLREGRVMTRVDHPNVLRCYDAGEARGYHYLAMEYVTGGSVEEHLRRLGKFTVGDALHVVLACARGLQHAHERGLVHRDVKPANILLDAGGAVKLADLGLAKQTESDVDLTRTGTGAGTPLYMAPEQALDAKHVDGRCDIYALGCVLYALLTGRPPFHGGSLLDVIEAKQAGTFPPLRRANPAVPASLDRIVGRMVASKAEQRYATCVELIADVEALRLDAARLSFIAAAAPTRPPRSDEGDPVQQPALETVAEVPAEATPSVEPPPPRRKKTKRKPADVPVPRRRVRWVVLAALGAAVAVGLALAAWYAIVTWW